jgi:hypothetical protein
MAPLSITRHVDPPATSVITSIRTAAHPECGYERLVLDFTGPLPGYDVRYVKKVTADASRQPITLPGRSDLLITLHPAQAHAGNGDSTITRPARAAVGYPMLDSYALAGDFEGVVSLALGLNGRTSIRVSEVPGHWYIDVKE